MYGIMCYTYIKIGVTSDVLGRIEALQSASPFDLELVWCARCPTRSAAFVLERHLHQKFESRRVRGEWFTLDIIDSLEPDGFVEHNGVEYYSEQPWLACRSKRWKED